MKRLWAAVLALSLILVLSSCKSSIGSPLGNTSQDELVYSSQESVASAIRGGTYDTKLGFSINFFAGFEAKAEDKDSVIAPLAANGTDTGMTIKLSKEYIAESALDEKFLKAQVKALGEPLISGVYRQRFIDDLTIHELASVVTINKQNFAVKYYYFNIKEQTVIIFVKVPSDNLTPLYDYDQMIDTILVNS